MNLCIDIGNTRVKLALIEKNDVLYFEVAKELSLDLVEKIRSQYGFSNIVVGASGRIPESTMRQLEGQYHLLIVDSDTRLPISIRYKTPETLGRDRIAAVCGAKALFPDRDNCVIDVGTCITYDVLLASSEYVGGNIAPGIYLRLKAMNDYTAALPLVQPGLAAEFLGLSTVEALQNGGTLGTILEIESFIERIREIYPGINVILTGGDGQFVADHINSEVLVNPNLVLIGLNEIMNFNAL